jgi:hypothetical protein
MFARTVAAALGFFALLAGTSSAEENIAVTDWANLCLAAHGDANTVLHAADAAGWSPLPQGTGRVLDEHGARHVVMIVDNNTRQCIVSHPSQGGLTEAVQTRLGHAPTYRDGGYDVWVGDNLGGAITWLSNSDAQRARDAFASGRAVTVRAGVENALDIVMYEYRP